MNRQRGFEIISVLKNTIPVPERKTKYSAGYDIAVIHPQVFELLKQGYNFIDAWNKVSQVSTTTGKRFAIIHKQEDKQAILLPTGIKAYMQPDEVLLMAVRSSKGIKQGIKQANPPSIIDADYYNNSDNEGHIFFAVSNTSIVFDAPIMPIAQGIFTKYLTVDYDKTNTKRIGGIGSTDK